MRSDNVTKGMQQAPHRSLFNALGYTKEELDRPLVGIVSSYNEIVPGHMNLDKIVEAVKMGVAMAGGTPIVFPAIAVCDGIAMGHTGMKYSLVTRDLIADSTECMAMAHQFDALVMVPNCDKNVPGLLMAAARLNIPTVFVTGGPIAFVEEGDIIKINIPENTLNVDITDEEMEARKAKWQPREPKITTGYLARYASMVTSGNTGAILKTNK